MTESLPYDQLKTAQRTALLALLKGDSIADRLDITTRTLRRWRRLPLFQTAYAAAQADFFSACRSEISRARAAAFGSLHQVARSCFDTATQVRAATTLLEYVSRPEMSAKPPSKPYYPIVFNNLDQFSPDNGGHPRTFADKTGPQPVAPRTNPDIKDNLEGESGGQRRT